MRSRTPHSSQFLNYISSNWAAPEKHKIKTAEVAKFAAKRRAAVAAEFAGNVLVFESGAFKVRSNDTDYMYRPHSAFAHLTGWGSDTVADSILVIDAREAKPVSTLYFRETAGRDSDEFFANSAIGEFWVGARPSLSDVSKLLDINTQPLKAFNAFKRSVANTQLINLNKSADLAQFVSELRLIKDKYEIEQMRLAVEASIRGFEEVARNLKQARKHHRGERIVETAFYSKARLEGNNLGYDTIAASGPHACTLHWIVNNGPVKNGDLLLLDAGVEMDSLYTADITRTLPVNGKFTDVQRKIYEAVREAADAAFAVAKPGAKFKDVHAAAMEVIAAKTAEWGLLPVSAERSLEPDQQFHRRWMVHGTSHHLGLDVHDCAQARREMYLEAELKPGMVFTIEPGLYFQPDDLLVPEEFRGIGVRIEDDILITKKGAENLSAALPRESKAVEKWLKKYS
ncbi:aminopeptidase P family protein [Rhodoluna sp.]|jgi:Xaa-Pro aminopeptidase|uniref:aminopeptidase P family protein n=1 Tax=Rhodoluna sp. TaxID=1969481 RepID=UPI0025EA6728|nr:aminopeptidase P family protein [Rhodoluna sp.]